MKKKIIVIMIMMCILLSSSLIVNAADVHTYTYTYSYWGDAQISPDGYMVSDIINGKSIGTKDLANSDDLFIDDNGIIYVADTGNNRILIIGQDSKLIKDLNEFIINNEKTTLNNPTGIYVNKKGELLIADRQNRRVLRSDVNGNVKQLYTQPVSDGKNDSIVFTGIDYLPDKVIEDENGIVYVLCNDIYDGSLMYSPDGKFLGYYGANQTEVTLSVVMNRFWRKFMTKEQREKTGVYFPYQFNNFYIDNEGFIYTCTELSETKTEQIKKINAAGVNVLPTSTFISSKYSNVYGDLKVRNANGKTQQTFLTDVTVDENGFITAVDYDRGHIFQYDENSNLLMVFGGLGEQNGYFRMISSVENYGDKLYVLDRMKNNITVFTLTDYGKKLHKAVEMYNNSQYKEVEDVWKDILIHNRNFHMAYSAIGKIYYESGEWTTAMEYFKKADDHLNYDKAYENYRNLIAEKYVFPIIFTLVIVILVLYVVVKLIKKKGMRR